MLADLRPMALDVDTSAAPSNAGRAHPRPLESTHRGFASTRTQGRRRGPRTGDVSVSGLAGSYTARPAKAQATPSRMSRQQVSANALREPVVSVVSGG